MPYASETRNEVLIGTYVCPYTGLPTPLKADARFEMVHWPMFVDVCVSCSHSHAIRREDLHHSPKPVVSTAAG